MYTPEDKTDFNIDVEQSECFFKNGYDDPSNPTDNLGDYADI